MAKRKPVIIDGIRTEVPKNATLDTVVAPEVVSVTTSEGLQIPRSEFPRTQVHEHFSTDYSEITKGGGLPARYRTLLNADAAILQHQLDNEFYPPANGERRTVKVEENGEYLAIRNFPLPDRYKPDHMDIVVVTTQYPDFPPVGIHLLHSDKATVEQLREYFHHTFDGAVISQAEEIPDYTWVCYHYEDHKWRFNARDLRRGDNIAKFLNNFYTALEQAK